MSLLATGTPSKTFAPRSRRLSGGRAVLTPWPKLFQNLRASRATELANEYPAHVAAAWLGHSQLIAKKHYWHVTDEHFETTAQKAAQQAHTEGCTEPQPTNAGRGKSLVLQGSANTCDAMPEMPVGDTGVEPVTSPV